jgi:hypothetical protein
LIAAIAVVGALDAVVAMPASTRTARVRYTIYVYKAKVAVKGGTTLSNAYSGTTGSEGDVKSENSTSSFSVDAAIQAMTFYKGKVPSKVPRTLESGAATVLNGTWSDQGLKWVTYKTTGPFTCNGTIASTGPLGNMILAATRSSSKVKFTLRVQTVQLTNKSPLACPNGSRAPSLGGIKPDVYTTEFSIPISKLGNKTIVVNFSGPLAKHRSSLAVVCSGNESGCTYNMAWHGNLRLTRTRVFRASF